MPADTGKEQGASRGRFQRGQSGNPAGRRPGARNRTCALALKLMDASAEEVVLAVIEAAKDEATSIASLIETRRRTIETLELEQRIAALERSKETSR